jgi:hypothetical protein
MMEADNLLVVCVDNDLKRTSVQVKPRASLCTATYEAVSNRGGVEPLAL